jgi:hypothetical protein
MLNKEMRYLHYLQKEPLPMSINVSCKPLLPRPEKKLVILPADMILAFLEDNLPLLIFFRPSAVLTKFLKEDFNYKKIFQDCIYQLRLDINSKYNLRILKINFYICFILLFFYIGK